ncbi:MAG TPA: AMP-dependent synthetase/ligase [Candidatus Nanopelagicales bacterium]|nr:AMP-dependent synthetase/ligase [Candidatus Nanopelagicales bacterium]
MNERVGQVSANSVAEVFQHTAAKAGDRVAIRTLGDTVTWTWSEYAQRVEEMAAAMTAHGVARGDTVGVMLTNRPEFHVIDSAAMHLGAAPFSVYNTSPASLIETLIANSGCRVIFTEVAFLPAVGAAAQTVGIDVVVVDEEEPVFGEGLSTYLSRRDPAFDFASHWRAVGPDDLLTIIYTSGTTGAPKGVEVTHANMLATLNGYLSAIEFPAEGRVLSWLPMAHVAERGCSHYLPMTSGYTTTCCPDATQLLPYLQDVHPTWFFAVPRAWEKLRAGMQAMVAGEPDEQKKRALTWGLEVARRRFEAAQQGEVPADLAAEYEMADEMVLSKMRAAVGLDQLAVANAGAAPSSVEVLAFFHALGIPVSELWGMSESCAAGCVNPPGDIKLGTVGPALPGFEIRTAPDGELLLRGPGVMRGYRGDPELTAATIDDEGWLHTGDVGTIDDDGYVTIVDRKKEILITSAGKNIAPARVEALVKGASPLIGQVVAVGDGRNYLVALITLDPQMVGAWAGSQGIDPAEAMTSPQIQAVVAAAVAKANADLTRPEQIKDFTILHDDWVPGGDELTPTMKLKRKNVMDRYARVIDDLYADSQ